jgi:hypothetical protein
MFGMSFVYIIFDDSRLLGRRVLERIFAQRLQKMSHLHLGYYGTGVFLQYHLNR